MESARSRFPNAQIQEVEVEQESGVAIQEVELTSAGIGYEVEVNAANAQILKVEDEALDTANSRPAAGPPRRAKHQSGPGRAGSARPFP